MAAVGVVAGRSLRTLGLSSVVQACRRQTVPSARLAVAARRLRVQRLHTAPAATAHADWHPATASSRSLEVAGPAVEASVQAEIDAVAARLGVPTSEVWTSAFVTRNANPTAHNGRLALLGKTVVEAVLTEYTFAKYPNMPGEGLSAIQAHFMADEQLAEIAQAVGIRHGIVHPTAPSDDPRAAVRERATCVKAVVAAVLLDQGSAAARQLARDLLQPQLVGLDVERFIRMQHPKRTLASLLAAAGREPPVTRMLSESGRTTHLPTFLVGCFSGAELLSEGSGWSIKRAEKEAVKEAILGHYGEALATVPMPWEGEGYTMEDQIHLMEKPSAQDNSAADE